MCPDACMHVCTVSARELKRVQIKVPIKLQGEHHEDFKKIYIYILPVLKRMF